MDHPSDEVLAAWRAGALGVDERDAVENHAASCAACRRLVVAMAGVPPGSASAGLGAEGAVIGRYRVTGSIGHGGMGVVLRGHDPVLDREVALKMSRARVASADERDRMAREAQTLARLDHPNVVRVFDAGVIGEDMFVAMEYVNGTTLARWLADAPRALAERLAVLTGVGSGIAAVHAAGLVHRDIKPDNILVRESGAGVLVDFGLARSTAAANANANLASGAAGSGVAGTPRYLAPELRAGAAATARSDQFAWWTVVEDAVGDEPRFARAIARGRSPDPAARYPTMTDAVRALAPRRSRARWLAIGAATVTALAGAAWLQLRGAGDDDPCATALPAAWPRDRAAIATRLAGVGADAERVVAALDTRARRTAELRAQTCRAARSTEDEVRTRAVRQQACIDDSWRSAELVFPGLTDRDPRMVRAAVDELVLVLPVERCASGALPAIPEPPSRDQRAAATRMQVALREIDLGADRDPRHRADRLQALAPEIRALHYPAIEAHWHASLGAAASSRGDYATAKTELEAAIRVAEAGGDDQTRARCLVNLLLVASNLGTRDTVAIERDAEATAARLGNPGISAELHLAEGHLQFVHGELPAALASLRTAQRELDGIAIDDHVLLVMAAQSLGALEQATGDLRAARATFDRGYAVAVRRFGAGAPETLQIRGARATNLLYGGEPGRARPELAAVAHDLERSFGPDAPPVAQARGYICECDLAIADADATPACDAALAVAERAYGGAHPQLAWQLALVGRARLRANHPADAIAPLERALAVTERGAVSPGDRPTAQAFLAIALHRTRRDPARAAQLARDATAALRALPDGRATIDALAAELR